LQKHTSEVTLLNTQKFAYEIDDTFLFYSDQDKLVGAYNRHSGLLLFFCFMEEIKGLGTYIHTQELYYSTVTILANESEGETCKESCHNTERVTHLCLHVLCYQLSLPSKVIRLQHSLGKTLNCRVPKTITPILVKPRPL